MRHHVQIDAGDRPGTHRVLVNGQDISKAVISCTLTIDARDLLPELSLRLANFDVGRYDQADTEIVLTDPTREALIALGWTPPEQP